MTTPRKKVKRYKSVLEMTRGISGKPFSLKLLKELNGECPEDHLTPEASKLIEAAVTYRATWKRYEKGYGELRTTKIGDSWTRMIKAIDTYLHSQKGKNGKG